MIRIVEHHIIPQFYLRYFCDRLVDSRMGPQLWVADLKERRVELKAPRGVVKLTNFYAIESTKGSPPNHLVEEFFRNVESVAAPVILRLRDGDWHLSDGERSHLATFMALLVVRIPAWRSQTERIAGKLTHSVVRVAARHPNYFANRFREANKQRNLSDREIEEARQAVLTPGALECRGTPSLSLDLMLKAALSIASVIFQMSWLYGFAPVGTHVLTGDNPVFWYDHTIPPPEANGLASRKCLLTFPIGPELGLFGTWNDQPPSCEHLDDRLIDVLNMRIVRFAERFVFASHKEDAEAALERRKLMEQNGESTGPREPDVWIREDMSSE